LVLLAIVVADAYRFADQDLWGHVGFGRLILSVGRLPNSNTYTYSAPGYLWLNQAWLAEATMAWLYDHFGVLGLILLKLASSATMVIFIALGEAGTGASIAIQLAVLIAVAAGVAPEMQIRPQMFTLACFSTILMLLDRDNLRGRAPLWLAIPILALWSNLHAGFLMGLVALITYGCIRIAVDSWRGRSPRHGLSVLVIAATATAATFATPLGSRSWDALIMSAQDPLIFHVMADWRPLLTRLAEHPYPTGITLYFYYAIALMVMLAMAFSLSPSADDLPLVAIAVVMSLAAFAATRNIALACISLAAPLARHWSAALARRGTALVKHSVRHRSWFAESVTVAVALALAAYSGLFSTRLYSAVPMPVGAVAFMKERGLKGNILNQFGWGQYLIWHTAPECRVFIDGRFDLAYPLDVIRKYTDFAFDAPEAQSVLSGYAHDFVLIEPELKAYRLMTRQRDWTLIYTDEHSALFARSDSAVANSLKGPVIGKAVSNSFP